MDIKVWQDIIMHLFVLCGVRKMTDAEHTLYITDMFSELRDKFTNEEIGRAARQIAETETLYGNYPPLSVWLKYCPSRRAEKILTNKARNDFLATIEYLIDFQSLTSDYDNGVIADVDAELRKDGGAAAQLLDQFGGVLRIRTNGRASSFAREQILREISQAWDSAILDNTVGALQIVAQSAPQIENKN